MNTIERIEARDKAEHIGGPWMHMTRSEWSAIRELIEATEEEYAAHAAVLRARSETQREKAGTRYKAATLRRRTALSKLEN